MDNEALRLSYKPDQIRLLFVGESPPANGGFFYDKSNMTTYTAKVFENVYSTTFTDTASFLSFFRSKGCYLDDICTVPIDQLDKNERKRLSIDSIDDFADRLKCYNPEVIIVILKSIEPYVKAAINQTHIDCPVFVLPFPGMGWQKVYKRQLTEILLSYRT